MHFCTVKYNSVKQGGLLKLECCQNCHSAAVQYVYVNQSKFIPPSCKQGCGAGTQMSDFGSGSRVFDSGSNVQTFLALAAKWFGSWKTKKHCLLCTVSKLLLHQCRWGVAKWYVCWIVGGVQKSLRSLDLHTNAENYVHIRQPTIAT